jgi:[glutamine synthetase] adenylyltransferase / [glutamine synthetase]-adenylyl-L-tyrosine phosphorylase
MGNSERPSDTRHLQQLAMLMPDLDWPLRDRLAGQAGANDDSCSTPQALAEFALLAGPAAWDAAFDALDGAPAHRFRLVKDHAMAAFWSETIAGTARAALGRAWSDFAGWCLDRALKAAWSLPANRKFLRGGAQEQAAGGGGAPGLFILGLGKLGGHDLNFSSDVDLVAFFDAEVLPVAEGDGRGFVTARVLRDMGKMLGSASGAPVWRIDWRLRPDPSVTDISMSSAAGLSYFHFQSEPWRRLAMMKARVVAGDHMSGGRFMSDLTPFLWRKSLDFRMIDDIADMKSRIRNENPDIAAGSDDSDDLGTADRFHFKLDRGGIREIEFTANALQLIWGGRHPVLRTTNTLEGLAALGDLGLIDRGQAARLSAAYDLFRSLENAVQGIADDQVYRAPTSTADRALVAGLAGLGGWKEAARRITSERAFVHGVFQGLFAADAKTEGVEADGTKPLDEKAISRRLSPASAAIVDGWRGGFVRHGVTGEARAALRDLPDAILAALPGGIDPDEAVAALDGFFARLPPGGQYLALMASQPRFLADIVEPIVSGGWAARLMGQTPHVADSLIERRGDLTTNLVPDPSRTAFFAAERDYEARLEAFRALVNERVFLACLAFQRHVFGHAEAARALTGIAAASLAIGCRVVADEYFKGRFDDGAPAPLSILAMGKFGLGELTPGSDLDLVYLAADDVDLETADRFARRLTTALGTRMRGGVVYEIDTRLRPSGNAGPPVLRLATLESHHMQRANTWEHLALVPARMAFGGEGAADAFDAIKARILARPRDRVQLACDAHKMLARLRQHRIRPAEKGVLSIKLRPGGLMEAEYLAAFLSLEAGRSVYDAPELMPGALREALLLWRHLQMIARMLGLEDKPVADPARITAHLPEAMRPHSLAAAMDEAANAVTELLATRIVSASGLKGATLDAWEEIAVRDA